MDNDYVSASRRGSESRCLSLTHCNVSTFLSGSANLAASLSNFSWQQQPRENRLVENRLEPRWITVAKSLATFLACGFASSSSSSLLLPARFSQRRYRPLHARDRSGIAAQIREQRADRFLSRLLFGAHTPGDRLRKLNEAIGWKLAAKTGNVSRIFLVLDR